MGFFLAVFEGIFCIKQNYYLRIIKNVNVGPLDSYWMSFFNMPARNSIPNTKRGARLEPGRTEQSTASKGLLL